MSLLHKNFKKTTTIISVLIVLYSQQIYSQSTDGYYSYNTMLSELQKISSENSSICNLIKIGSSRGKEYYNLGYDAYRDYQHDIWAFKLSDNASQNEDEINIYFTGLHHARELMSLEVVMAILNDLITKYNNGSSEVRKYIDNYQIWFIPLINPDGHKIVIDGINPDFRWNIKDNNGNKMIDVFSHYYVLHSNCINNLSIDDQLINELAKICDRPYINQYDLNSDVTGLNSFPQNEPERTNTYNAIFSCFEEVFANQADGVDLNRIYEYVNGSSNINAWSEPEIVAVRNLFHDYHFVGGFSYHSYAQMVIKPFSYSSFTVPVDNNVLDEMANEISNILPVVAGSGSYSVGYLPAFGTSIDYNYGELGCFEFVIELEPEGEFIPTNNERLRICDANLASAYYLLDRMSHSMLSGIVKDSETNQPIEAKILVEGIDDFSNLNQKPIHKSDDKFGRYYRLLSEGNYTVTIIANGYMPQTFTNVNISETGITELNIKLLKGTGYYWPLDKDYNPDNGVDLSAQHTIIGQFGDCRGNRENINKGIEIKVPTNKQVGVYAVQSGIAYTDFSSVSIGNFRYENLKSIQISSGKNISQGTLIGYVNGDRLLFMENTNTLTSFKPADNWINPLRKNGLTPYADNASPIINGFVMYQNGTETDMEGRIFGKVDIVIDAFDPAVNSDGSANNDYNCGIYKIVIQFLNSKGEEISNSKIEYFSGFSKMPNCSPKEMYASGSNSETFLYIATNDPFNSPYDKYWNSRQKIGQPYNVDAMFPNEAKFAEGGLKIKVTVYDYAGNKAETD